MSQNPNSPNMNYEVLKQSSSQEINTINIDQKTYDNISNNATHTEHRNNNRHQNSNSEIDPTNAEAIENDTNNINNKNISNNMTNNMNNNNGDGNNNPNNIASTSAPLPEDPKLKKELDEYIEKQKELLLNPIENLNEEEYNKVLDEYRYLLNLHREKKIIPEQKKTLSERHQTLVRFQFQRLNPQQQEQYLQQQREHAKAKKIRSAQRKKKEMYDNLRYYAKEISSIIRPVILCVCLSILWVKLTFEVDTTIITSTDLNLVGGGDDGTGQPGENGGVDYKGILNSFLNAGLIIGNIIIATFVILFLFKFNCTKILYGLFIFTVFTLIGIFGYNLLNILIYTYNIPMDWITLLIFMFNLSIVGVIVIFWKGPAKVQQGYLILMSSLMAFSLTNLADWTTWILLSLLACWDLIAVLCPFGPLKMLVEHSDSNKQMIPQALIYSTMVWMMAQDVRIKVNDNKDNKYEIHELTHIPSGQFDESSSLSSTKQLIDDDKKRKGKSPDNYKIEINDDTSDISNQDQPITEDNLSDNEEDIEYKNLTDKTPSEHRNSSSQNNEEEDDKDHHPRNKYNRSRDNQENGEGNNDDEDEEGLKLGLGDFVFYSVLIARAAMHDWITTFSCAIAVLTGLTLTIFLLSIYQKALPALPISIVLGIIFYIFSSSMLGPLMTYLTRVPIVTDNMNTFSGLKLQMNNGCGFVYL